MDELKKKYDDATNAVAAFSVVAYHLKQIHISTDKDDYFDEELIYQIPRDACIKRFEIALDTLWKYLKRYLEITWKIYEKSPKDVFTSCADKNLLSEAQTELALKMIDDRNKAAHIYKEEIADIVATSVTEYAKLMEFCLEKTKP